MTSPQRPAKSRQTTATLQLKKQDRGRATRPKTAAARYALLTFLLLAAGALAILPGSSAATRRRAEAARASAEVARAPSASRGAKRVAPALKSPATLVPNALLFQAAPAPPSVATYAADCTTPKSDFNLGDTVCVKVEDMPTSGTAVVLNDPDNLVRSNALGVTASSQSFNFALPSSANSGDGTDNRGAWTAAVINTEDNSRNVSARFFVHDTQQAVADVTISKTSLDLDQVVAGGNATYRIYVTNQGPDAGTNVSFTDNTMPNTTFVSFADDGASGFSCTPPAVGVAGSTVCTKATMAIGETASFTAVYKLNGAVANGTGLTDTATITSATTDSHPSSNSSTVDTTVTNPTNPTCSLTCPSNVAVVADAVENFDADNDPDTPPTPTSGAHVALPAAQSSGTTCGTVSSSIPSGSFFPVGSTPVTYTASDGATCSFVVTVTSSGSPVSISCPANITANADADCEVAVALGTPSTTGDNVTVTGSRSDGKPLNAPFTSGITTITWTASNSSGTESCSQTVTIIDVTPPVINVPNPAPVSADANCQAVIPDLTGSPGITDNCACDSSDDAEHCAGHSRVAVTQSPAPGTVVGLGPHTITLTANDGSESNGGAGNTTTAQVTFTVNDTTPPVISCPVNISVFLPLNTTATSMPVSYPAATATDNCGAPTISYSKASGSSFNVGTTTVTATADDGHGNTASCTFTVTVLYNFTGFFSPVSNPPVVNSVNAGRAIPVKFSLSGNKGLNIFAPDSPSSTPFTCGDTSTVDVSQTVDATANSINYDASSDQYNFVWKTQSSWAGQCRTLTVTLNDGSTHTALFKFK